MRSVRSWLFDNFSLKLLALLLAVLIHIVVRRDSVHELSVNVPFQVTKVPDGKVFVGALPQEIELQVRGRWGSIRALLNDRAKRITADLSTYRDGERHTFEVRDLPLQLRAAGVKIVSARPSGIDIRLEALATRLVPVQVSTTGTPASGFAVGPSSVRVSPKRVEVRGPANVVKRVRQVRVAPVDLTGADRDLRVRARLLGVGGPNVKLNVQEVDVQVQLEEQELTKTQNGVQVTIVGCPKGLKCTLKPSAVTLRGKGPARLLLKTFNKDIQGLVVAHLEPAIKRKVRMVRLETKAVKGLSLTVSPKVAKFTLLGEIPAD